MRMRIYLRGIPSSLCRSAGSGERLSFSSFSEAICIPSTAFFSESRDVSFLFVESSELDDAVANCRLYMYIGQLHMHRVDYNIIAHSRNSMYF